jgi:hypothetical protein
VDGTICYLNTDLDLTSADDLTALAAFFETNGFCRLRCDRAGDGLWYATFEVNDPSPCGANPAHVPENAIAAMLSVVESIPEPLKRIWAACTRRQFDIGYDCGSKPWAFNQGLSAELLGRIAAVGASLRITLYPEKPPVGQAPA